MENAVSWTLHEKNCQEVAHDHRNLQKYKTHEQKLWGEWYGKLNHGKKQSYNFSALDLQ